MSLFSSIKVTVLHPFGSMLLGFGAGVKFSPLLNDIMFALYYFHNVPICFAERNSLMSD